MSRVKHTLEPDDSTLHGFFDPDAAPVLTIDPGDTVTFRTLDCWWRTGAQPGLDPSLWERVPQHRAGYGHALVGPVAVRGARAGMTLVVHVDAVLPGTYGATVAGGRPTPFIEAYGLLEEYAVLDWSLDPAALRGTNQFGHRVALRPFMGVLGMPPAEPGRHSTIPPRSHGGNLDLKDLVAGSTLYLPVPVDGALFSVGDGHAAQGDGEVGGTAIECPMDDVTLTFDLRDDLPIGGPVVRSGGAWLTLGLGDTVDAAMYRALNAMFDLMGREHGVRRAEAAALASVAVDLRITQIVNRTVGAHAVLRDGVLDA
jgi:acetamidase/formamidase